MIVNNMKPKTGFQLIIYCKFILMLSFSECQLLHIDLSFRSVNILMHTLDLMDIGALNKADEHFICSLKIKCKKLVFKLV